MDAFDRLSPLREQVTRLRAERDRARGELARAQQELETARTAKIAAVRAAAQQKRKTSIMIMAGVSSVVLVVGVGTFLWMTHVTEETLTGTVRSVQGPAPASVGERCTARLSSEIGPFNARLVVECSTQLLYGYDSFGAIRCSTVDGRASSCSDPLRIGEDGDPRVTFERGARLLTLSDGPRWNVHIALDP